MSYCSFIASLPPSEQKSRHAHYHDCEYGFPLEDDNELFGRLLLEINQAGLSWDIILKKQAAFRAAYSGFDVAAVAAYDDAERARLRADAGIVRNRLKIDAAIHNAQAVLDLQTQYGSFAAWLACHHPLGKDEWVKLFRRHFRFVGGEIVGEFLMSIGILPGAHDADCPIYRQILQQNPL